MIPISSIIFMAISATVSIGLPFLLFFALRKKFNLKFLPLFTGAVAFILFALLLEQILHGFVFRPDENGVIWLLQKPALYVLYGVCAAGIFEETARFVSFLFLKRKNLTDAGTGFAYGIGHGGIEAILLAGFAMISSMAVSIIINTGGSALADSPQVLETLIKTNPFMFLASGFERIAAIVIHISLSMLVWSAVNTKGRLWLYPLAICLHALINVPAAMAQVGIISSILLVEILAAVGAVLLAFIAYANFKSGKKRLN